MLNKVLANMKKQLEDGVIEVSVEMPGGECVTIQNLDFAYRVVCEDEDYVVFYDELRADLNKIFDELEDVWH